MWNKLYVVQVWKLAVSVHSTGRCCSSYTIYMNVKTLILVIFLPSLLGWWFLSLTDIAEISEKAYLISEGEGLNLEVLKSGTRKINDIYNDKIS